MPPRHAARSASVALALLIALGLLPVTAQAAGPWTGIYIDGPDGEPLSGGLQTVLAPPDVDVDVTDTAADRSVIEVSAADWVVRMEDRDGEPLAVGSYDSRTTTGELGYHGMAITGPGGDCPDSSGRFVIRELVWNGDAIDQLAVDWWLICHHDDPLLAGSIRSGSSIPIVGVASDTDLLDLGETSVGMPSAPQSVEFTSIGQAAVHFGTAYVDGNREGDVEIVDDDCSDKTLAPGDACTISIRMTGIAPMFETGPHLILPEDTPREHRYVYTLATVHASTSITMEVDPTRSFWPGPTYVTAEVSPPPRDGIVRFRYDDGHGTAGEFTTRLYGASTVTTAAIVPRGTFDWTATFEGHLAYDPSTSATVHQAVGLQTYTTLVPSIFPIRIGDTATFTATVHPAEGQPVPPGTITLRDDDGTTIDSGPVGGDEGTVAFHVLGTRLGTHEYRASYVSDTDGQPTSAAFRLGVTSTGITQTWAAEPPWPGAWFTMIAPAPDGVFAGGTTPDPAAGPVGVDVFVARYDAEGQILWTRKTGDGLTDQPIDLVATSQAVFLLFDVPASAWEPGHLVPRHVLVKYDLAGNIAWTRSIDVESNTRGSLAPLPDGGVAIAFTAPHPGTGPTIRPAILRIYRANGAIAWEDVIGADTAPGLTSYAQAIDVASDPNGVTLLAKRTIGSHDPAVVRRYGLGGMLLWERVIGALSDNVSPSMIAASDEEIRVSGTSQLPITGTPNAFPGSNVFVRSFRFDGAVRWTRVLAPTESVGQCRSFVTVGATAHTPESNLAIAPYVIRTGADEIPQWRWEVEVGTDHYVEFRDVSPTRGGRVYVFRNSSTYGPTPTYESLVVALDGVPSPTDCDTKPPTTSKPTASLAAGTSLGDGTVPLRLRWTGSDSGSGIARYRLERRAVARSGPWSTRSADILRAEAVSPVVSGRDYRFRVSAVDGAGNVGPRATSSTVRVERRSEGSRTISYSGDWSRTTSKSYQGRHARWSSVPGSKTTVHFVGRSIAWVASTGPGRGKAAVYVDGKRVATVDLRSASTRHRQVVWAGNWSKTKTRRITIKVLKAGADARVNVDAFLTIRS